jgi:flavodoxin
MKSIIVYTSIAHGNTEKVAKAMAEVLNAALVKAQDATPEGLTGFDLLGFGSGIYNGKNHQDIFALVSRLPSLAGKKVFVFSTSGYGTTKPNDKLAKELEAKGAALAGQFACKGLDTYGINRLYGGAAKGHPNEDDLNAARAFARKLAA